MTKVSFITGPPLICASLMGLNGIWVCDLNVCLPVCVVASPFPFSRHPFSFMYLLQYLQRGIVEYSGPLWPRTAGLIASRAQIRFAIIWKHSHQICIVKLNPPAWHRGLSVQVSLGGLLWVEDVFLWLGNSQARSGKGSRLSIAVAQPN